jgi:hypothetical protein
LLKTANTITCAPEASVEVAHAAFSDYLEEGLSLFGQSCEELETNRL